MVEVEALLRLMKCNCNDVIMMIINMLDTPRLYVISVKRVPVAIQASVKINYRSVLYAVEK